MPHKDPAQRREYYRRYRATGPIRAPRLSPEERFWAKVDKSGGPDACWLWTGAHGVYGFFTLSSAHQVSTHRHSLEMALGRPLAPGEQACHHCDNPLCVNPAHLFVGTNSTNMLDMWAKGRGVGRPPIRRGPRPQVQAAACKRGHPFPENRDGRGGCRVCRRERNRLWMRAHYVPRT